MRKNILAAFLVLMAVGIPAPGAWAHQPLDIQLEYDLEKKNLHIEVKHVSRNMNEEYIRKLEITRNQKDPRDLFFARQTTPTHLIEDISFEAEAGDVIVVAAFSSEGGSLTESMTVQEADLDSDDKKDADGERKEKVESDSVVPKRY